LAAFSSQKVVGTREQTVDVVTELVRIVFFDLGPLRAEVAPSTLHLSVKVALGTTDDVFASL
jgi:hypothetical protein